MIISHKPDHPHPCLDYAPHPQHHHYKNDLPYENLPGEGCVVEDVLVLPGEVCLVTAHAGDTVLKGLHLLRRLLRSSSGDLL